MNTHSELAVSIVQPLTWETHWHTTVGQCSAPSKLDEYDWSIEQRRMRPFNDSFVYPIHKNTICWYALMLVAPGTRTRIFMLAWKTIVQKYFPGAGGIRIATMPIQLGLATPSRLPITNASCGMMMVIGVETAQIGNMGQKVTTGRRQSTSLCYQVHLQSHLGRLEEKMHKSRPEDALVWLVKSANIIQGVFLTGPPHFQYQKEKLLLANGSGCSRKFFI